MSNTPAIASSRPTRYHPAIVVLHWLVPVLMLAAVVISPEDEGGGSGLGLHTIIGGIILVLMLIRLALRWLIRQPEWATTGNAFLDLVGRMTHYALYFITFFILVTGAALLQGGGGEAGEGLRGGFFMSAFHALGWLAAFLLIGLHAAAALYHQFILKDSLLGRMWFGKRTA